MQSTQKRKVKNKENKNLFDHRCKHACILLKVLNDATLNQNSKYLNCFFYYPVDAITGMEYKEVLKKNYKVQILAYNLAFL